MMTILQDQASGERSQDQWSSGSSCSQVYSVTDVALVAEIRYGLSSLPLI